MKYRILNKIYANLFGYFWSDCPSCGKMFGGHEVIGSKVILKHGHTYCCCPDCENNPHVKNDSPVVSWDLSKLTPSSKGANAEG